MAKVSFHPSVPKLRPKGRLHNKSFKATAPPPAAPGRPLNSGARPTRFWLPVRDRERLRNGVKEAFK